MTTLKDTAADALAARYPHPSPRQCRLPGTAIVRQLATAARRGCAMAAVWPQPDGTLHISVLFVASGPSTAQRTRSASRADVITVYLPDRLCRALYDGGAEFVRAYHEARKQQPHLARAMTEAATARQARAKRARADQCR